MILIIIIRLSVIIMNSKNDILHVLPEGEGLLLEPRLVGAGGVQLLHLGCVCVCIYIYIYRERER